MSICLFKEILLPTHSYVWFNMVRDLFSFIVQEPHVSLYTGCVDSVGPTNPIEDSPVEQHMSLSSSLIQSMSITLLNLHMDRRAP